MSELLGPGIIPAVLGVWAVIMIAVPIVAAFGSRGRAWGISLGVLAQVAVVVTVLGQSWSWSEVLAVSLVVPGLGWFAEFAGSRTGIPFGRYHYTMALQPQIHRVPVVIPLAWLMMLPPSWAVAQVLLPESGVMLRAVLAGYAFMAWDVYLDPHLTKWGFWSWDQNGSFEGIPVMNFFGWFLWATVISAISLGLLAPFSLIAGPLVVVYTITWLLQAGGHFVFWRWPVSGIGGFVLMGVVAVPAIWLILG